MNTPALPVPGLGGPHTGRATCCSSLTASGRLFVSAGQTGPLCSCACLPPATHTKTYLIHTTIICIVCAFPWSEAACLAPKQPPDGESGGSVPHTGLSQPPSCTACLGHCATFPTDRHASLCLPAATPPHLSFPFFLLAALSPLALR